MAAPRATRWQLEPHTRAKHEILRRYPQGSDRLQPEIDEIRAALAEGRTCAVALRNYRRDGSLFRNALRLLPCESDNEQAGGQQKPAKQPTNADCL
jgi:hypothetical protein